jgi:hypothetical protein
MSAKHQVQIDMETVCKNISASIKANEVEKDRCLPIAERGGSAETILVDHAQERIVELQIIQGNALELKKEIDTYFRKQGFNKGRNYSNGR